MKFRFGFLICTLIVLMYALAGNVTPGLTEKNTPSGATAPSMWVTPLILDFGPIGVGSTSSPLQVSITNVGDATLSGFAGGGVSAPFSGGQNCAGGVSPGNSCQYTFTFSPTAEGIFTTTSNSGNNAGSFSIELRGEGVGPRLHVSATSLDFGRITVNGSAPQQAVTIHNTGLAPLTSFAGGGVSAPFSASQNCASGVPPGGICQYFFNFSPTSVGLFTATSNSSSNGGPFAIDLQGRGQILFGPSQRATPLTLDFGPIGVGASSGTLTVDVTNQSPGTTITGFAGGSVNAPFSAGQNCAPSLSPGATCQFSYSFNPTETGVFTTTSNVSDSVGSFSVQLRGEGVGAGLSVTPLLLDFGHTIFGQPQVVTIKNTGMSTLTGFAGGGVSDPFSASQNCVAGVPPGGTCQFTYQYNPIAFDRHTATSNVSTNGGSFSVQLVGGIEAPVLTQSFTPSQITPGEIATLQYQISNPNAGATFFSAAFNNAFPTGLSVANPLLFSASPECSSPNFSPTIGDTSITFWDATILTGDVCVINVNVTAADIGIYTNTLQAIAAFSGYSDLVSATLQVGGLVYLPIVVR